MVMHICKYTCIMYIYIYDMYVYQTEKMVMLYYLFIKAGNTVGGEMCPSLIRSTDHQTNLITSKDVNYGEGLFFFGYYSCHMTK